MKWYWGFLLLCVSCDPRNNQELQRMVYVTSYTNAHGEIEKSKEIEIQISHVCDSGMMYRYAFSRTDSLKFEQHWSNCCYTVRLNDAYEVSYPLKGKNVSVRANMSGMYSYFSNEYTERMLDTVIVNGTKSFEVYRFLEGSSTSPTKWYTFILKDVGVIAFVPANEFGDELTLDTLQGHKRYTTNDINWITKTVIDSDIMNPDSLRIPNIFIPK